RLPRPRPDFADAADDIKDAIGADGLAEINPDDMRVTTNPHSAGGRLGDFGLPGAGEEEQQATASGPSGPFGGMGGNGSMWNDPRGAIDSSILNPAGANSHSKDAPSAFGGLSVKSVRVSDINPAGEKDPKVSDTGWRTFSDSRGSFWTRSITTTYPDRSSVSEVYTESDGDLIQEVTITDPDGNYDTTVTVYDENGDQVGEPDYSTGTIVTELRNPDYTDGGGYVPVNCGSVECNESRKGRPGLRLSDGMVRALTDPEHSAAGPRNGVAPIVTQHDLLSQYDPDFTGGGAPTPIDKPRIQSD
ncbi:MAG TPA: hypothetical protein VKN63_01260, partial [Afifellaceae bacterium]|nr:hypothetical protein [Afifellaceae bacterium]